MTITIDLACRNLISAEALGNATRKFEHENKIVAKVEQIDMYQSGITVFNEWLNDMADVQD